MKARINKYYEAILQIREVSKREIDFIEEIMKKMSDISIAGVIKTKNGYDYYLYPIKHALFLAKRLMEKFGGFIKISKKLYGVKDGRKIYRTTVLFRGSIFKRGDILKLNNEVIRIETIGKNIIVTNIKKWKRMALKLSDVMKMRPEILEIKKAVISKRYPRLEIIHPETYQSVEVENPKKVIKEKDEKVNVVLVGEKVFLI